MSLYNNSKKQKFGLSRSCSAWVLWWKSSPYFRGKVDSKLAQRKPQCMWI